MSKLEDLARLEDARDAALQALCTAVPYHRFLGVRLERMGDELTAILPFSESLVGNPLIPAIHGGVTGAFLEITAITRLAWDRAWSAMEAGGDAAARIAAGDFAPWPKTVDISIDYLRSGKPRAMFARADVVKQGRRVANLRVEAWQAERSRPVAALHGHFLMPDPVPDPAPAPQPDPVADGT